VKTLSSRIRRRTAVLTVMLGLAVAPVIALGGAASASVAAPRAVPSVAVPQTVYWCDVNEGPTGVVAYCDGENAAVLTVYCTSGTASLLAFLPGTLTVTCPAGGTVVRFTIT
jgi:hypothetical protein